MLPRPPCTFDSRGELRGVERLDQPCISPRLLGEEHVGITVEQEHDPAALHTTGPFLVAEIEARGHTTHGSDLQIEEHDRWVRLRHSGANLPTGPDPDDLAVIGGEGRIDLVEDRVGVGGDEDGFHGRQGSRGTVIDPKPGVWAPDVPCR